jgi:hypothetical protein
MEIWFADPEVAAVCSSRERLRAHWGTDGGLKIGRRLQQMKAAPTLTALRSLPGRCQRRDCGDGGWMIDIDAVATILFRTDPPTGHVDEHRAIVRATVISIIERPIPGGGA